jgi:integrase
MQFMLLTLARRDEVAEARRRDVRNGVWVIPTTKSGREHRLALPRQALALLTLDGDGDTRLFPNARGGKLGNWDRETKLIREKCGLAHFTRHDLRRTGATMLGEMGVEPHIIEAALNHTSIHSSLASVYNRSRYSMPVANALEKLADILDGTAGAENVLPFGREAA